MKIRSLLAAMAFIGGGAAIAQNSGLSLGLEVGIPVGGFGEIMGIGFGGTLGFELPVGDAFAVMAQAGYLHFTPKLDGGPTFAAIPVQIGAKYYFIDQREGPYLGVLGGLHMSTFEGGEANTSFSAAPLVGYMISSFDISLRYQMMIDAAQTPAGRVTNTNAFMGIRAAIML